MKQVPIGEAWKRKYPEQIGMAVTVDSKGAANVISLGWVMPTSGSPPLVAISIGHTRYSHELIRECKEFVLAFPNEEQGMEMLFCGTYSGRDVDKEKDSGFDFVPAKRVKPPLIKGCVVNFECMTQGTTPYSLVRYWRRTSKRERSGCTTLVEAPSVASHR
jgi:flavin reductase (DIM6/NTAB) family NADH-FMN oxidoreductase RutF